MLKEFSTILQRGKDLLSLLTQFTGPRFTQHSQQFINNKSSSLFGQPIGGLFGTSLWTCLSFDTDQIPSLQSSLPSPSPGASPASPDPCPLCFLPSLPPSCFTDSISVFSTSASRRHGLQTGEHALGSIGSIKKKATQSQGVYSSHQCYICIRLGCSSSVEHLPGNAQILSLTPQKRKSNICFAFLGKHLKTLPEDSQRDHLLKESHAYCDTLHNTRDMESV